MLKDYERNEKNMTVNVNNLDNEIERKKQVIADIKMDFEKLRSEL